MALTGQGVTPMADVVERSNGEWKANRDFTFRNLECAKGERLPDVWQRHDAVKYLKETYGADCITFVPHRDQRARKKAGAAAPQPSQQPAAPPAKAQRGKR